MDDFSSGSDEKAVSEEVGLRDDRAARSSIVADDASPSPLHNHATPPLDADATIMAPRPMHREPDPESAGQHPSESADAATILTIPRSGSDTGTSSAATIGPVASVPQSASAFGTGAGLLAIGTILGGRYEILNLLGQGGMGAVYKAADREVDRIVALKVIRPDMAANREILARFKQELLLSSQVTDRNVIRIYDLGEAQGIRFITMEYVEGDNLHTMLKQRGKLEVPEAVEIMEQVAAGLAAAHREGIIHRDLKPANIMRDKSGRVVVMDFGLARTFSGDGMTQTGMMLGTMEYMSPEQAQGMDVTASSDVFTFGLILYELLSGTTPFYAESAIASLLMRSQKRAAPLIDIDKTIPGALSDIVVKCLEKDPARRYQSAEHLDSDLRAWQGRGAGRTVAGPTLRLRAPRPGRLPWLRIGLVGALTAAIVGGSSWYMIGKRKAAAIASHSPVSVLIGDFANHTGDSVLDNTLEPMLGVAMEGASFINVYSRGDARKLAKKLPSLSDVLDEQSSRLVAISQEVKAVITGSISLRGDEYEISAIVLDSGSGKVLAKAEVTADSKQAILSELPKLAVPIRKALGDTTSDLEQLQKVSGGFTSTSLDAVHEDAVGVEQQFAGKFQDAFDSFKKASETDPHFARAYTGMAAMSQNLGRPGDAVKYMKLAMDNKDRMTERELYRNQGLYFRTLGDWQNCVKEYTQLIDRYPADRVGQNNLAICYLELRNAPKALEAAKHAVEIVPRGVGQRLTLAFISAFASDFSEAEKQAREALKISPEVPQGFFTLAEAQLGKGQIKDAADTYGQLENSGVQGASTAAGGLADLAAYRGNYADAARILTAGITADLAAKMLDNAARKYAALANIEELQGHQAAALADIGKALAGSQSTQIQFLAAMIYVDFGDTAKSQRLAAALLAQESSEPKAYGKIVTGLIALKRKDSKEAISQLKAANNLLDTWIGRLELGRIYLETGAFTDADSELQRCINRRGEATELFDDNMPTYSYLPPAYYFQGRAREGLKTKGFADSYNIYLSIRGQSPDDPLVPEIKHRLGQ